MFAVGVELFLWLVYLLIQTKMIIPSDKDFHSKSFSEYILPAVCVVVVAIKKSPEIIIV